MATQFSGSQIRGAAVNVLDYMTKAQRDDVTSGTGSLDVSGAIQAAIDAVEATGRPGVVEGPGGTYLCDTGLIVDTTVTSLKFNGALFLFTNLAFDAFAITLTAEINGYAGGAYYSATNYIEGIRFKGREGASEGAIPIITELVNCFKLERGVALIGFGYEVRNCVINNFTIAVELGDEFWGMTFRNCNFAFNQTNFYAPAGLAASGAKILFDACIFQNGKTCFHLNNTAGTTYAIGCNIEAMTDSFFYANAGELQVSACSIEQASGHTNMRVVWRDSAELAGITSHVSISDTTIILKGTRTQPAFEISNPCNLTILGGQLFIGTSTYTGSYFETNGASTGTGTMTVVGTYLEPPAPPYYIFDNLDPSIDVNAIWAKSVQPNSISFRNGTQPLGAATETGWNLEYYREGTWAVTPINLTVTGSPIYTGTYTRIGDLVFGTLVIDPNGGTTASIANTTRFTGLPYTIKTGGSFAGSVVTVTTVGELSARIEGAAVYTPTWGADALLRTVSFWYRADS